MLRQNKYDNYHSHKLKYSNDIALTHVCDVTQYFSHSHWPQLSITALIPIFEVNKFRMKT